QWKKRDFAEKDVHIVTVMDGEGDEVGEPLKETREERAGSCTPDSVRE
ncbi:hypothetical protein L195_g060517, partial [Trifolium pratense]